MLAASLAHGLEGVVGKPLASAYHPGQRRDWIKVKNVRHAEVVICGWKPGEGPPRGHHGSLLLGVCERHCAMAAPVVHRAPLVRRVPVRAGRAQPR